MRARRKGFTLIELMIVVVVIAILSAIAYPSYTNYVRKGKRAEAKTRLLQVAQLQERYFTEKNAYLQDVSILLYGAAAAGNIVYSGSTNDPTSGYQITAASAAAPSTIANSFVLTATPQGGQTQDTACMTLTLSHTGQKTFSGTGPLSQCWN